MNFAQAAQLAGVPQEKLVMMSNRIRSEGIDDASLGAMMRTAQQKGLHASMIADIMELIGVPRAQYERVMHNQGLFIKQTDTSCEQTDVLESAVCESDAAQRDKLGTFAHAFTKENMLTFMKRFGVIVFWIVVWHVLDMVIHNRLVIAGPISVVASLCTEAAKPGFWIIALASFGRIALGFMLSCCAGILLSAAAYKVAVVRAFLDPLVSLLRTIPVVAIIIMLLIWVGNQLLTIYLSFLIVFPLIYINMLAGFESVDYKMLEFARVYRLSPWRTFVYIYRPAFMPFLSSACKMALGMSWKSGIMAEVLANPIPSIGREMAISRTFLNTPKLFAWTVVVMILSWLFEKLVMKALDVLSRPLGRYLGVKDDR
jgi:hypothetical protein